jgi:NAD dependent epimerase/dehydratase family enzyme
VPRAAVRLLFGRMGEEALLGSVRVRPAKLGESGFEFRFPVLDAALRAALSPR